MRGTVRPTALAVFMLIISSTLVACWTGSSAAVPKENRGGTPQGGRSGAASRDCWRVLQRLEIDESPLCAQSCANRIRNNPTVFLQHGGGCAPRPSSRDSGSHDAQARARLPGFIGRSSCGAEGSRVLAPPSTP